MREASVDTSLKVNIYFILVEANLPPPTSWPSCTSIILLHLRILLFLPIPNPRILLRA